MKTSEFLNALCRALNKDPETITIDDTAETVEEWDSVGHLSIIATIDSELGISTEAEELQRFTSIRQLVETLKDKGALED